MTVDELTPEDVAIIKRRLRAGDLQHEIAADYRINQGRISEINTGQRFADVEGAIAARRLARLRPRAAHSPIPGKRLRGFSSVAESP